MIISGSVLRFLLFGAALSAQNGNVLADSTSTHVRPGAIRHLASLTYVPVVGGVTTSSAKIQFRTDDAATVFVEYSAVKTDFDDDLITLPRTASVSTVSSEDFTAIVEIDQLAEDETYYYRVSVDGIAHAFNGELYEFSTMPAAGAGKMCEFAVFADVSNIDASAPVYGLGLENGAKFALQIGDLNHGDPNPKQGRDNARAMHKLVRDPLTLHGADFASNILTKMPLVHMFDDHDFCGNDSSGPTCNKIDKIIDAFKEYYPSYEYLGDSTGVPFLVAQKFDCGDAEIFVLDTRTQRSPEALSATEAAAEGRSMLGAEQLSWLQDSLRSSTAPWKIIISSVTASKDARDGVAYDNWAGFEVENQIMYDFFHDEINPIDNVVMISADIHTGGGIDDGRNNRWGIPEMTVAHTNLVQESLMNNGRTGSWSEGVTGGSFPGYSLVTVDANTLRMRSMGNNSASTIRHELELQAGQEYFSQTIGQELVDTIAKFEDQFGDRPDLKAKFVRLGFHDCAGGCDGCIDDNDDHNNGLHIPIEALLPIVNQRVSLSRADIWAAAALWGAGSSQDPRDSENHVSFSTDYMHIGRVDCEVAGHTIDAAGAGYSSDPMNRHLPSADLTTHGLLDYFRDEFGYSDRETVAIMGAHTLGQLNPHHSGFNSGQHGWVQDRQMVTLDNTYYSVLVGPVPDTDPMVLAGMTYEEKLYDALDWDVVPAMFDDGTLTGKFEWEHFAGGGTIRTVMTNADIALSRDLDGIDPNTNAPYMDPAGSVSCIFKCKRASGNCRKSLCPAATMTLEIMDEYQNDNYLWVEEFRDAFVKMLMNRYAVDPACTSEPCNLVSLGLADGESCTDSHQCFSGKCLGSGLCSSEM